ncbi:MAG: alanine racemase [Gemmatimonadetes bacterium]|nr:alanine racemase [Gemmatimonadota bacterium]
MDSRTSRAWVEVDLDAVRRNARTIARQSGRPLIPMVKADAYGHGAVAVARALVPDNPWGFGVATVAEAGELRAAGVTGRILIFSPLLPWDFAAVREVGATPTLGAPASIDAWIATGGGPWHLAIDTGMHRAGIEWHRIGAIAEQVRRHPPEGAFTHFHSADANDGSMAVQQDRFRAALAALPGRPSVLHAENSPGVERQGPSPWDVVRPGVFLYGVGGASGSVLQPEPVAHLRARVVDLHEVPAGEGVSYGATWKAERSSRIATLPVGYADGYRRAFSSRGTVLLNGRRAPVVGRVTMDMTMVDVTDVPCALGDVATLLGRAGDDHLDINVIAEEVGLLSYELLVGLKLRVPRIYLGA